MADRDQSLVDQGVAMVKAQTPDQFRVGATFDGKRATGGISYDRKWSNGWGATAFVRGWWEDKPVVPTDKWGYAVGVDVVKDFKPKP